MHEDNLHLWQHSHAFGQDLKRQGETRTLIVIAITAVMMIVEIATGIRYGSMALLADGLHMASHTVALGINAFAYMYARRHAHNETFSFGTGKVNTLGGYTGAVLLAGFALAMLWESAARLISPVEIAFNQAIFVAVLGLIVNGVSVLILGHHHHPEHVEDMPEQFAAHAHHHEESHDDHDHHEPDGTHAHHHHDHNLISAYLHVLADALTSLLAIFALLAAKYFGLVWADPAMGVVGAVLVARWSLGLLRTTSNVLLDREASDELRDVIKRKIEAVDDNRIADFHIWAVGPNLYSVIISLVTHHPRPPEHYKALIPPGLGVMHVVVEVHTCTDEGLPVGRVGGT
jgi:cation diffusion facilitator family transporter